jgi:hypothetical protein
MSVPDKFKEEWEVSGKKHSVVEANATAHKALELAEKLDKAMSLNPGKFLATEKGKTFLGYFLGGGLAISCLISATIILYQNQYNLSFIQNKFLTGGLMLGSAIGIGIYFVVLSCNIILGENIIHVPIFVASLALGLGIFMMIVAIKSRRLPG